MTARSLFAVGLLVLGVAGLILGSLKFESRHEVFRVGDFRATTTRERSFPAIRYVGGSFLLVGTVLLAVKTRSVWSLPNRTHKTLP